MTRPYLLIVEDDAGDAELALQALAMAGFGEQAERANGGPEAWTRLNGPGRQPAAVFLDLKMPVMSGFELLDRIRERWGPGEVPVVVFTSSDRQDDMMRAYALGANSYLVKPMRFEKLNEVLSLAGGYWLGLNQRAHDG